MAVVVVVVEVVKGEEYTESDVGLIEDNADEEGDHDGDGVGAQWWWMQRGVATTQKVMKVGPCSRGRHQLQNKHEEDASGGDGCGRGKEEDSDDADEESIEDENEVGACCCCWWWRWMWRGVPMLLVAGTLGGQDMAWWVDHVVYGAPLAQQEHL
eukprot:scaffold275612_cov19-Tisochrysis_lutea.AAC.1